MQHCITQPIKLCNKPLFRKGEIDTGDCRKYLMMVAYFNAEKNYRNYLDSLKNAYVAAYKRYCMLNFEEEATRISEENDYHYTLYYYDRAGNLVRTVPPAGVVPLPAVDWPDVKAHRDAVTQGAGSIPSPVFPAHTMATHYRYNSYNQPHHQNTPDGGESEFFYDKLGRIVASQNAKQAAIVTQIPPSSTYVSPYSYSIYDALGRIVEVGQIYAAADPSSAQIAHANWPLNWGEHPNEIVKTIYDQPMPGFGMAQQNLRNRVAATAYYDNSVSAAKYATHYSYDFHGNVDRMYQQLNTLQPAAHRTKTIEYGYDLVSGNVHPVK